MSDLSQNVEAEARWTQWLHERLGIEGNDQFLGHERKCFDLGDGQQMMIITVHVGKSHGMVRGKPNIKDFSFLNVRLLPKKGETSDHFVARLGEHQVDGCQRYEALKRKLGLDAARLEVATHGIDIGVHCPLPSFLSTDLELNGVAQTVKSLKGYGFSLDDDKTKEIADYINSAMSHESRTAARHRFDQLGSVDMNKETGDIRTFQDREQSRSDRRDPPPLGDFLR